MVRQRQTTTKSDLRNALSKLLLQQPFESITIRQLTETAGINRGTFYLHYVDKYDMFEQMKMDMMQELDSLFVEGSPVKVNFLNVLTAIKDNYDFIYALSQSCCSDFRKLVRSFTLHALDDTPHSKEHIISDFQVPYKYGLEIFIATIESVIVTWLESGAKEEPIEIGTIILSVCNLLAGTKSPNLFLPLWRRFFFLANEQHSDHLVQLVCRKQKSRMLTSCF